MSGRGASEQQLDQWARRNTTGNRRSWQLRQHHLAASIPLPADAPAAAQSCDTEPVGGRTRQMPRQCVSEHTLVRSGVQEGLVSLRLDDGSFPDTQHDNCAVLHASSSLKLRRRPSWTR